MLGVFGCFDYDKKNEFTFFMILRKKMNECVREVCLLCGYCFCFVFEWITLQQRNKCIKMLINTINVYEEKPSNL